MRLITILFCLVILTFSASAQTKTRVKFAGGASEATVRGNVTGYKYMDYMIGAKSGQTLTVKLRSSNENLQFYVYDKAMAALDGSSGFGDFSGVLPADGDYTVRVLLPRSAARRKGAAAQFSVTITVK